MITKKRKYLYCNNLKRFILFIWINKQFIVQLPLELIMIIYEIYYEKCNSYEIPFAIHPESYKPSGTFKPSDTFNWDYYYSSLL